MAKYIPAWLGLWCIRFGTYLQAIGRECYHQCDNDKQCVMRNKLEKVYAKRD